MGGPIRYLTERQKEILEFIAEFQRRHGLSPTHREICQAFNYSSYGTVYKHLKLLQDKGYLRRDWNQKRGIELIQTSSGGVSGAGNEVPFYGLIAAGQPLESWPGEETLTVPAYLLGGPAQAHYVLQVVGDSMVDEGVYDGDRVVVLRRDRVEPGEMVVALVGNEATLKRFYPDGEFVRLQPANPRMKPLQVPASQVRVQGVVVGLMRKY